MLPGFGLGYAKLDEVDLLGAYPFPMSPDHHPERFAETFIRSCDGSDANDANGNIKSMKHHGMKEIRVSTTIDDMTYLCYDNGNKLRIVKEPGPFIDHKLGDFTDKNSGDDYGYDRNGNVITDLLGLLPPPPNKKSGGSDFS